MKEEAENNNDNCFCLDAFSDHGDKCAYTQKQKSVLKVGKGSGGHQRLVLSTSTTKTFAFIYKM